MNMQQFPVGYIHHRDGTSLIIYTAVDFPDPVRFGLSSVSCHIVYFNIKRAVSFYDLIWSEKVM